MRDIQQITQIQWQPVNLLSEPHHKLAPLVAATTRWLLNLLDETEKARQLNRTGFDVSVQERYRKAS